MPSNNDLQAFAEEDITVAAAAIGLTLTNVLTAPPPRQVDIFVEDAQVRYTVHGTDPSASVGETLDPGDRKTLYHPGEMFKFKAIRVGSTSATLRVRYKR